MEFEVKVTEDAIGIKQKILKVIDVEGDYGKDKSFIR